MDILGQENLKRYGKDFQTHLIGQIIRNKSNFGDKIINNLIETYFEFEPLKRLLILIKDYNKKYDSVPNYENLELELNISNMGEQDKIPIIKTINYLKKRDKKIHTGVINDDFQQISDAIRTFIKTQEYKRLAAYIYNNAKQLEDPEKSNILSSVIDERIKNILKIEDDSEVGTLLFDRKNFIVKKIKSERIPTTLPLLDLYLNQGYEKKRIYGILAPTGVGKTTLMVSFAKVFRHGYNALFVTLEDSEDDIKSKMYSSLTGIEMDKFEEHQDVLLTKLEEIEKDENNGHLVIKKFESGDLSPKKLQTWVHNYEKQNRIKFDVVFIDYIECMVANKQTDNVWGDEVKIVRGLESMSEQDDLAIWYATQSDPKKKYQPIITSEDVWGSKEKVKKAHILVTMGRDIEQKRKNLANIMLEKSKISKDGILFENSIVDNGCVNIILSDNGTVLDNNTLNKANDYIKKVLNKNNSTSNETSEENEIDENDFTKVEEFSDSEIDIDFNEEISNQIDEQLKELDLD